VATFLLKKTPFTTAEVARLKQLSTDLAFSILYAPGEPAPLAIQEPIEMQRTGTSALDYRRLILADDPQAFIAAYPLDIRATTDDRPFFFHTTRLIDQGRLAFGSVGLFGNGLSALITLMMISAALVVLFVLLPLAIGGGRPGPGWPAWLAYFGALGAGFMLLEVALLQRFVLLLGHPVYSLTVTLFSLLAGTGLGSLIGRRIEPHRVKAVTVCGRCCSSRWSPSRPPWYCRRSLISPLRCRWWRVLVWPGSSSSRSAYCLACRCRAQCGC
jgi:hypothetical protein